MTTIAKKRFDLSEGVDFNLSSSDELLTFTENVNNNNFEPINIIFEDGDSIYSPPIDELKSGQVYVSEDKVRDIVNEVLDKRLGVFQEDE